MSIVSVCECECVCVCANNYVRRNMCVCVYCSNVFFAFSKAPPIFWNSVLSLTALTQSPFTLPCDVLPDPTISFVWQFNGTNVVLGEMFTLLSSGSLMISTVGDSNEGTFTCIVTNTFGRALGTVVLDVQSE